MALTKTTNRMMEGAYVNVLDYGADPTGSSDSTSEIQAAIDAAGANTVYVPDGTFLVNPDTSLRLGSNQTMCIDGTIQASGVSSDGYEVIRISNLVQGSLVENVKLYGTGTIAGERDSHTGSTGESGHVVFIFGAANVLIEGLTIKDGWGDGIYIRRDTTTTPDTLAENITVTNCYIHNNRRNNVSVVGGKHCIFDTCIFENANGTSPQTGIDVEPNNEDEAQFIIISNCTARKNQGNGFYVLGGDFVTITGCHAIDNELNGIEVRDWVGTKITNNTVGLDEETTVTGGDFGALVTVEAYPSDKADYTLFADNYVSAGSSYDPTVLANFEGDFLSVTGNQFDGGQVYFDTRQGVFNNNIIQNSTGIGLNTGGVKIDGSVIMGNTIHNSQTNGVDLKNQTGTYSGVVFANNVISDSSQATANTSDHLRITGDGHKVIGNVFWTSGAKNARNAVTIESGANYTHLTGNTLAGYDTAALSDSGTGTMESNNVDDFTAILT